MPETKKKMTTAADVMTATLVTVSEKDTLDNAAATFEEQSISGAPVVDDAGNLIGVLSRSDVTRAVAYGAKGLSVKQAMTPAAFTVTEDTTVPDMARMMVDEHLHRLVVVRGSEAVGIVSALDLVALLGGR